MPDLAERAEALLGTGSPAQGRHLAQVREDTTYFVGSSVPALGLQFLQLPSGLIVPSSIAGYLMPQPIGQIKAYLEMSEWLGAGMSLDEVATSLSKVTLEHAIQWVAFWLARGRHPGVSSHQLDQEFIERYLSGPTLTRVRNLLRNDDRVLVVPQGLTLLAKLAFAVCTADGLPQAPVSDNDLMLALLGLSEHMDAHFDEDEGLTVTGAPGRLGRSITANQMFNANADLLTQWSMFHRIWRELPYSDNVPNKSRVVDLSAAFEETTGVPLDDLVTASAYLWSASMAGVGVITRAIFDDLKWPRERLDNVLVLIATNPADMRERLDEDVNRFGAQWSTRVFDRYPVVRWNDDAFSVIDPELMAARALGGWPVLDIRRESESGGNAKLAARALGCYRHLCEVYALEAIAGILGSPVGVVTPAVPNHTLRVGVRGRVYDDQALRRAYPGSGKKVADAAVDYGHAWVVFEVTTVGPRAATIAGTADDSLMDDIKYYIGKCSQLEATINDLCTDETSLTGSPSDGHPHRFHPVLTIAAAACVNPIFMTLLRERLTAEGILQNHDTAPIEVFEVVDLDAIEGLGEMGGPSLLELLQGHQASALHQMPMKDYISLHLRLHPEAPARVAARSNTWAETIKRALDEAS